MLIIRAYQNFLIRLISVQQELGSIDIESAMKKLKPPLFGQNQSNMNLLEHVISSFVDLRTYD